MKYKLWHIIKLILVGALPVFFSLGGVIVAAPLSYPTYVMSGDTLNAALLSLCYFLYPMVTLLILENIWYVMGDTMKSNDISCPVVATGLSLIIPTGFGIWGYFYSETAIGNMLFGAFALSVDDVSLLLGLKMYSGLTPFNGYLAFVIVLAIIFYMGCVKFPAKNVFRTWYVAVIPPCFYNAILAAQGQYAAGASAVPEGQLAEILGLACRIAWPAMFVILLRSVWRTIHPREKRKGGFLPKSRIEVYRGL